jgi:hypothetical protein
MRCTVAEIRGWAEDAKADVGLGGGYGEVTLPADVVLAMVELLPALLGDDYEVGE